MKTTAGVIIILGAIFLLNPVMGNTKNAKSSMSSDKKQVNTWNQFAEQLYILHQHQITQHETFQKESTGGYMGSEDFYREVKYFDKKSGILLSRVLWEIENPDQIHEIEVFVYNYNGKLKRDYLAAFLPGHRNAPVMTLINFHYQNDELKSFRQFDASGEKIYERCEGKYFNKPLFITLEDVDFAGYDDQTLEILESEEYLACFERTMPVLGDYVNPLFGVTLSAELQKKAELSEVDTAGSVEQEIKNITKSLKEDQSATLYYKRGMAYLKIPKFSEAIDDFSHAIKLDNSLDGAYFGRGLAYGRLRMFDEGIADLSVFIERNPRSSLAYTKRGVRRIWAGKYKLAEEDLKMAISLDPTNAEAHDDLGVMDARNGNYKKALANFEKVVNLDPSYSKGFHNLAMTQYILGKYKVSLVNISKALELMPNNKNSLLLKGEILLKLGKRKEAEAILDRAEFLPEGGWQERFSLQ